MAVNVPFRITAGRRLGAYRVLDFLGEGWEGEVYKVEEIATGIIRAAKLFYKHRYSGKRLPHVEYAKKLYRLRGCSIVLQYHHQDTIKFRGQTIDFLVSDFVDGVVLSHYVATQPARRLLPFEALHLFYALVQGIEQVHFAGEYHGDIHTDNIIIRRHGLHFEVFLIDLLHLGKTSKVKMQHDIHDLIHVFYDIIGGAKYYNRMPVQIKQIILGRKQNLINKKFKVAGDIRLFLENMSWD